MAKKPVKIKTTFNLKKLANNLDNIVVEGLNLQAKYLNDDIQNGIDLGVDIDGNRFKDIGLLRKSQRAKKNQGTKILDATGNMRKTKLIRATTSNPVSGVKMVGKNKKGIHYGALHNQGGVNEQGNILPQRKWFGITLGMRPGGDLLKKTYELMKLSIRRNWRKKLGY